MTRRSRSPSSPSRKRRHSEDPPKQKTAWVGHPIRPRRTPLALANPLSEEAGYMRTSLLPGLLNMVGYNLNRGNDATCGCSRRARSSSSCDDRHDERRHLAFAATGDAVGARASTAAARAIHVLPHEGRHRGVAAASSMQVAALRRERAASTSIPAARRGSVMDGECVAHFGQLHPEHGGGAQVAAGCLCRRGHARSAVPAWRCANRAISASRSSRRSSAISPSSSTTRSRFERHPLGGSKGWASPNWSALVPAEIYRGEKVGAGKYSVLLHAEFQSQERTLRDDEVAQWSAQIITALEGLGGVLRA